MLTGFEKSEFVETITVHELTVMLLAAPCVTSIFEILSEMAVLEYKGRLTSVIDFPPIRHGTIYELPITAHSILSIVTVASAVYELCGAELPPVAIG